MYMKKQGISQFFAFLTLQTLLYKSMTAFFLETIVLENMDELKGKGGVLTPW